MINFFFSFYQFNNNDIQLVAELKEAAGKFYPADGFFRNSPDTGSCRVSESQQ